MAKFPKEIFVKAENGGSDPDYFVNYENIEDATEMGVKNRIGVYQLVGVQTVEGIVKGYKPVQRRFWPS